MINNFPILQKFLFLKLYYNHVNFLITKKMALVMMKTTMKPVNTMEEIAVDQMLILVTALSVNVQIQIMEEVLQVMIRILR